jgi:hypothetical protein
MSRGYNEEPGDVKLNLSAESLDYKGEAEYLPALLKHNKEIAEINARKTVVDSVIAISPVILVIVLCGVLVGNNLRNAQAFNGNNQDNNNYETGRTEYRR